MKTNKKLKISIVAFLDFLGYGQKVKSLNDDAAKMEAELNNLSNAIEEAEEFIKVSNFEYKFFTDNLIVATEISSYDLGEGPLGNILGSLAMYQLVITSHGYFLRGGLEAGYNYIDDKLVFGDALIDAYILESKYAKYPRIILGDKLKKLIDRHKEWYSSVEKMPHFDVLDKTSYHIDYLKGAFNFCEEDAHAIYSHVKKHKDHIEDALQKNTEPSVIEKFEWLKEYHNNFCNTYRDFKKLEIVP